MSRPGVYSSKERGGGGGGVARAFTTDHTNGCLEAAIRSEGCVYVLGWEHQLPDCRAVREQRLNMK